MDFDVLDLFGEFALVIFEFGDLDFRTLLSLLLELPTAVGDTTAQTVKLGRWCGS